MSETSPPPLPPHTSKCPNPRSYLNLNHHVLARSHSPRESSGPAGPEGKTADLQSVHYWPVNTLQLHRWSLRGHPTGWIIWMYTLPPPPPPNQALSNRFPIVLMPTKRNYFFLISAFVVHVHLIPYFPKPLPIWSEKWRVSQTIDLFFNELHAGLDAKHQEIPGNFGTCAVSINTRSYYPSKSVISW